LEGGDFSFFQEYDATMDAPHQVSAAGHDPDTPRSPASERLQLEVVLLAAASTVQADQTKQAEDGGSPILLAVSDTDIRDYIKQCLRAQPGLRIVETRAERTERTERTERSERREDDPFDVARRIQARLLITDLPIAADDTRARGIPVILTGDELPEQLPVGGEIRIAFLLQPFNARRLLEAVDHLLVGSGSSPGAVPRR